MSGRLSRAREFLAKYPRATRLVLVVGVLFAVAAPLSRLIPRGLDVTFELGRNHSDFDTLRVAYLPVGQDSARALTQRFPGGAPASYVHHVELAPGRYEIHARLENRDGSDAVEVVEYVTVGRSSRATVRVEPARIPGL